MLPHTLVLPAITIANGETSSGVIDLAERVPSHILFPASFTGSTVSFTACHEKDGTFAQLVTDDGTVLSVTASDSKLVSLAKYIEYFKGIRYLKIVSASSESGAKTLYVYTIPLL